MASQFTDAQISTWAQIFERELCAKHDFIVDRISLGITPGVNEYQIPNYVTNIRSVLWLGRQVFPKGHVASQMTGDTPFQTAGSVPFEYVFSGKGLRVLKFYPTPLIAVAYDGGDLWNPTADRNDVIVEFCRTPDYLSVPQKLIPPWCRQYLLKDFICQKVFAMEGPQQDLRAANYYQERVAAAEDYATQLKANMHASEINVLFKDPYQTGRKAPGRPVLPPNFGFPVNW